MGAGHSPHGSSHELHFGGSRSSGILQGNSCIAVLNRSLYLLIVSHVLSDVLLSIDVLPEKKEEGKLIISYWKSKQSSPWYQPV